MIASFQNEPFDFVPGAKYQYNNSAYYLLGVIIEKVTGVPYRKFINERLLPPLGLRNTMFCEESMIIPHRARGYEVRNDKVVNADPISMNTPGAAGSLCSTVLDLLEWRHALFGGRVVSSASLKMTTPATLNDGSATGYGYGLGMGKMDGHRRVGHGGGINGFISELHHYPDDSLVTVVLTNTGALTAVQLERLIARRALGIKDLPAVPIAASALERLVGEYAVGSTPVRVFVENGRLRVQQQGNPAFGLKHVGGERFVRDDNDDVQFEFPAGAPAPSMVRHQSGMVTTATRVP